MRARLAAEHLDVLLGALQRACATAVERQRVESAELDRDDDRLIGDREVELQLDRVASRLSRRACAVPLFALNEDERRAEVSIRRDANSAGIPLPFDAIRERARLTPAEVLGLVVVAANELDRGYATIYRYLADDADLRGPSIETLLCLLDGHEDEWLLRRRFGPLGTLRTTGILHAAPAIVDLHAPLTLRPGVLDLLLGADIDAGLLVDAPLVASASGAAAPSCSPYSLEQLAVAFEAGLLDTLGVWGATEHVADEAVHALAVALDRSLVVVDATTAHHLAMDPEAGAPAARPTFDEAQLQRAAIDASASGSLLWIRIDADASSGGEVAALLRRGTTPVVVSSTKPWRAATSLVHRSYAEVHVAEPSAGDRRRVLEDEIPGLSSDDAMKTARRWRLSTTELQAAASLARTAMLLDDRDSVAALNGGCATVAALSSGRLVHAIEPRRGADMLILPDAIHRQVLEIAAFTRSLPTVIDDWGFGRVMTGGAGVKSLFIGDPGTGKTLAAEVIAHSLGVQLLRVDLAQLVSKWVGETAKHLDAVFAEAASGNAVLFFDEADALFGRRGDVRHGTDRYANTEVSHLLQRFEQHRGLVILASNLRQNIDPAFVRRFDSIVSFPRPTHTERKRLWAMALPPGAPLGSDLDLDAIAGLDMTGAGIVTAARIAALLAADRPDAQIEMRDVVLGIVRQYQSDGRILAPGELGQYQALALDPTSATQRPVPAGWT